MLMEWRREEHERKKEEERTLMERHSEKHKQMKEELRMKDQQQWGERRWKKDEHKKQKVQYQMLWEEVEQSESEVELVRAFAKVRVHGNLLRQQDQRNVMKVKSRMDMDSQPQKDKLRHSATMPVLEAKIIMTQMQEHGFIDIDSEVTTTPCIDSESALYLLSSSASQHESLIDIIWFTCDPNIFQSHKSAITKSISLSESARVILFYSPVASQKGSYMPIPHGAEVQKPLSVLLMSNICCPGWDHSPWYISSCSLITVDVY